MMQIGGVSFGGRQPQCTHSGSRLHMLFNLETPPCVSLSHIPPRADWGMGALSSTLCASREGHALQIHMVGVLVSLNLVVSRYSDLERSSVCVYLLREADREGLERILRMACPRSRKSAVAITACN